MPHKSSWQNRVLHWLKDPWNVTFLVILLFGIIIRLKYFNVNTGLWWDEGEYLSKAKNWAFGTVMPNAYWTARPITLTLLWAVLLKLGSNVSFLRFTTELLPSIGTLIITYLFGKELYNKKIGVLASAMMAVFWLHLFFTARLLMDLPGLFFSLMASYCFWKGFIKKDGTKYVYLTLVFFLLTALTKYNDGIILIPFILILFLKERFAFLKNKQLWIALGACFLFIAAPYLIFNYLSFGDALPAITTYILSAKTSAIQQFDAPAYYVFNFFHEFLLDVWFWFFLVCLLLFWKLFLSFDLLWKRKDLSTLNDFFLFCLILFPLLFFVFIYKFAVHQYLFLMTPAIFLLMAKGMIYIQEFLEKYNKYLSFAVIILLFSFGAYAQLQAGVGMIETKKNTYVELREAGLWIKAHTAASEPVMLTSNQMEFGVFAERRIVSEGSNITEFEEHLADEKPRYIVLSLLSANPNYPWIIPTLNNHPERFVPVQAWFADADKKQPRAVIYKVLAFETSGSLPIAG